MIEALKPPPSPMRTLRLGPFLIGWQWAADGFWGHKEPGGYVAVSHFDLSTVMNEQGQKCKRLLVGRFAMWWAK